MAQPKAVDRAGENPSWPKNEAGPLTNGTGGNGQPPGLRSLDRPGEILRVLLQPRGQLILPGGIGLHRRAGLLLGARRVGVVETGAGIGGRGRLGARGDDRRRGRGRRNRGKRGLTDGLVGRHRRGGLHPHPRVAGLVDRDRDGVDAEEVGGDQRPVHRVIGRELTQRRHGGQRGGVGAGRRLVQARRGRALGRALQQPGLVWGVGGHVLLGAGAFPGTGVRGGQQPVEFCRRGGVLGAHRRPGGGGGQQRRRSGTAAEQRRVHFGGNAIQTGRSSSGAFGQQHEYLFGESRGWAGGLSPTGRSPGPFGSTRIRAAPQTAGVFARRPAMRNDAGMRCDVAREALSARLDGERPQVLAQQVDAHLEACRGCRS